MPLFAVGRVAPRHAEAAPRYGPDRRPRWAHGTRSGSALQRLTAAHEATMHCAATNDQNTAAPEVMTAVHAIVTSVARSRHPSRTSPRASFPRIAATRATWVLPGHGAPWSGGVDAAIAAYEAAARTAQTSHTP